MKTRRDYAEQMSACFNFEVQSENFGNSCSLSIEGSSVETLDGVNVELNFRSQFSDESRQYACTMNAHMGVLVEILKGNGKLITGSILYDKTDGFGKQYRCGTRRSFWVYESWFAMPSISTLFR